MDCIHKVFILVCLIVGVRVDQVGGSLDGRVYEEVKNNSISFEKNLTQCRMYTKHCTVKIYVEKSIKFSDLKIYSDNTDYFKYMKVKACQNLTNNGVCLNETTDYFDVAIVYIEPVLVGVASLIFQINSKNISHMIVTMEPNRWVDKLFTYYILVFQLSTSIMMGILLDVKTIVKIVKMPIPVIIGLTCQYGGMPVVAYFWIKMLNLSATEALALFVYGCCPGGSGSNNWTILFNGDIDLSAIMTFVSTIGSLVFMPAWLYTVGQGFLNETQIKLPFLKLITNLFITIGPCLLGLIISRFFPKIKPIFLKIAKPVIIFMLVSVLALMFSIRFYVFKLATWRQWVVGPFIPWTGFLLGALVSIIFRQPKSRIYTISIETGIQNIGIAFLILIYNFPSPQKDYAMIPLLTVAMMTTLPLYVAYLIKIIADKIKKCGKKTKADGEYDVNKCYKAVESNEHALFIDSKQNDWDLVGTKVFDTIEQTKI